MAGHKFIVVDDHPLFRNALRQILANGFDGASIIEAGSFSDLVGAIAAGHDIDLVLLDLTMPGVQGFSGLIQLRTRWPELPVVVVSASCQPVTIRRCLQLGALGFIPKTLPVRDIRRAIAEVLAGEIWTPPQADIDTAQPDTAGDDLVARLATLTPQQLRVLSMLSEGLLNKQIAHRIDVSEATVKAHVSAILQKLGVDSRTQAVIALNKIEGLSIGGVNGPALREMSISPQAPYDDDGNARR